MKYLSIPVLLFVIMFALKIAEVGAAARLSWWIVTLPLWLPLGFAILVLGGAALIAGWLESRKS